MVDEESGGIDSLTPGYSQAFDDLWADDSIPLAFGWLSVFSLVFLAGGVATNVALDALTGGLVTASRYSVWVSVLGGIVTLKLASTFDVTRWTYIPNLRSLSAPRQTQAAAVAYVLGLASYYGYAMWMSELPPVAAVVEATPFAIIGFPVVWGVGVLIVEVALAVFSLVR